METIQLQVIAGVISSGIFISSTFPMIFKAFMTRDLKSYSLGNLALSNLGNLIHWVYVSSFPFGPIWFLHGFNTLVTALMLLWYFRYELAGIPDIRPMYLKLKWMCKCGCASASRKYLGDTGESGIPGSLVYNLKGISRKEVIT